MKNSLIFPQKAGQKLKKKRLALGLSLKDASRELKIREKFLLALEEGEYEILPSETYTKGFLRSYAKYLEVNEGLIISLYRRETGEQDKGEWVDEAKERRTKLAPRVNLKISFRNTTSTVIFIGTISIILFFVFRLLIAGKRPLLVITQPLYADSTESEEYMMDTTAEELTIQGEIGIGNSLYLNDRQIETFGFSEFEIPLKDIGIGENTYKISTKNQFGIKSEIVLHIYRLEERRDELEENSLSIPVENGSN